MTREEQLVLCKQCTNRKMDLQQGLVCTLTNEHANFENECPNFSSDPEVELTNIQTEVDENGEVIIHLTEEQVEKLRMEQNLPMAIVAGSFVGIVGAILWGMITVATNYQIGYMALAIGAGVGFSMRYTGKGMDQVFGISGGIIAILSCVLGNFFSIIGYVANAEGLTLMQTLVMFDYSLTLDVMMETFSVMDILFYGIAGYEGYKFAFRKITEEQLAEL
ncbi:hypothetical protein [Marinifilum sp. D714]|uniref:hypothetical protein n=1 Tax=Marinifilum sp. D714 TaxID=2937523 RepID=UPI0027C5F905|nr:hypothetical protein [Marinifilum sp. D714]MDQ2177363.1 hypothetical protein [Marinifilum sp. D714]